MSKHISNSKIAWGFRKIDHKEEYGQLLLDQEYVDLILSVLRDPISGRRYAFVPRVLLSGAVSAAIRYDCFAGIFSVLANKILELPVPN